MQTSQVFASALICVAAVLGDSAPSPTSASPSFTTTPTALADSQIPAKLPELYTPPPERLPQTTSLSGDVTIGITNRLFNTPAVSIVGFSDAGSQPPRKTISGTFSQTTSIVVPSGWAGAFILDKVEAPFDDQGSRIEGNWGIDDPYNQVYLGVSYVAGYSVPIVCSCGTNSSAIPVTGCNKSLFSFGTCSYPQLQYGSTASPVCVNTSPVDGPPETFFKPCEGAAYTYPNDGPAIGVCAVNNVQCCLGTACPANPKQPYGSTNKPDVAKLMAARRGLGTENKEPTFRWRSRRTRHFRRTMS